MTRPMPFIQSTITRATKAMRAAGVEVDRVEISRDDGKVIIYAKTATTEKPQADDEALDQWLKKDAARKA